MSNVKIVIPTLERYKTLKERTLKYLHECNIPKEQIYIFVASEHEREKYQCVCGIDYNYIIGERGKANISNFIIDYFDEDEKIFCLDDDITYIYKIDYINKKVKTNKITDLNNLINDSFEIMDKCNAKIFGFLIPSNDFWIATDKRNIKRKICLTGACFGMRIDKDCKITTYIDDLERSLFYWNKYNQSNISFTKYSFHTPAQWNEGGLFNERTKENYVDECKKLMTMYPNLVLDIKEKKKGKIPYTIRLKQIRQKENLDIYYNNENCYC